SGEGLGAALALTGGSAGSAAGGAAVVADVFCLISAGLGWADLGWGGLGAPTLAGVFFSAV
ncbi:MAG TPA: hypothetical protein VF051_01840, partial [Hyphomicrobiaceae bacterium]